MNTDYSNIIRGFTWSYSRATAFDFCPYKFFLNYILCEEGEPMFFSDYGSFLHQLIAESLNTGCKNGDLTSKYLIGFKGNVVGKAPSADLYLSYFKNGVGYLNSFSFPYQDILCVEEFMQFDVCGYPFVGIVDCVAQDGDALVIIDNKSRALKQRSGRNKPTRDDKLLDSYLRQLYLYSIPVKERFGRYPDRLEFNCFRTGAWISEKFDVNALEDTKEWVVSEIEKITGNTQWDPNIEKWKCSWLCEHHNNCEYYELFKE